MNREQIEQIYDQGKEVMVNFVENLLTEFQQQINDYMSKIEKQESKLAKNSQNSSKPPSSDGLMEKKNVKSQRKKSTNKVGGQKGHKGSTLNMSEHPDNIVALRMKECTCCGKSLENIKSKKHDKRQEFEIPKISVQITEYQSEIVTVQLCTYTAESTSP